MARSIWESIAEAVDSFESVDDLSMTRSGMADHCLEQHPPEEKCLPDPRRVFVTSASSPFSFVVCLSDLEKYSPNGFEVEIRCEVR